LLHPVVPFITEAVWQQLNELAPRRGPGCEQGEALLVLAGWPNADAAALDAAAETDFALLQELIREVRNVRMQHNVPPKDKVSLVVQVPADRAELVTGEIDLVRAMAGVEEMIVSCEPVEQPADAAAVTARGIKGFVPGVIDRQAELTRLGKQKETLTRGIKGIEGKLGNAKFVAKAPPEVVQRERDRLAELQQELSAVEKSLAALG
jgi:valyl-tRNA synthetase